MEMNAGARSSQLHSRHVSALSFFHLFVYSCHMHFVLYTGSCRLFHKFHQKVHQNEIRIDKDIFSQKQSM